MTEAHRKKTILIVEHDVIVRMLLAAQLRTCNYVVIEASNGEEAKAVIRAGEVDIVFAEAQPEGGESGFTLAQWMRRYRPSMDVVLVNSLESKVDAICELCSRDQAGGTPSNAAALLDRIRAMLAERRRRTRPSTSTLRMKRRSTP